MGVGKWHPVAKGRFGVVVGVGGESCKGCESGWVGFGSSSLGGRAFGT